MKSTLTRILVLAAIVSTGLRIHAQDLSSPVTAPIEYLRPMKNSFSIGVRMIGGANVTFSGALGSTPYTINRGMMTKADDTYRYNDGHVSLDSIEASGNRPKYNPQDPAFVSGTNLPGGVSGRFYTILLGNDGKAILDGNGAYVITGNYVDYSDQYTRDWSYNGSSQLINSGSQVVLGAYSSAGTQGATAEASNSHAPGIEMNMGRVIQRFKHFEWGFTLGFGLAEFNAKTRQNLPVKLDYIRDTYDVYNTGANNTGTPTKGALAVTGTSSSTNFPAFITGTTNYGAGTTNTTLETTNPISQTYVSTDTSINSNGTSDKAKQVDGNVDGYWQVKGVYYIMRIGPMVRIPIGRRFSAYVSAGYMGAYIGSKFRYEETVYLPNGTGTVENLIQNTDGSLAFSSTPLQATKQNQQFLNGYYADANLEWWLSTRTGFYAGLSYEKLSSYDQVFNGRKASVKMDAGLGWRFGIITRF